MNAKKVYVTTPTLCKNGVTKPITRARWEKDCPVCGLIMLVDKQIKGGVYKRKFVRWKCTEQTCNHSEMEEGELDDFICNGGMDKEIGILEPLIITE